MMIKGYTQTRVSKLGSSIPNLLITSLGCLSCCCCGVKFHMSCALCTNYLLGLNTFFTETFVFGLCGPAMAGKLAVCMMELCLVR